MTLHSDRPCMRGCVVRDAHFAACADFGLADGERTCAGCVPVSARDGAMICDRCYFRIRRYLDDAPDLVAHLRSITDPTKAAVYDRVMVSSSKPIAPAPVQAELIDASADIVRTLRDWASHVTGKVDGYRLVPGAAADVTFDVAWGFAGTILDAFDEIANTVEIAALGDAILTRHPGEPDWWSIADASARWPLDDQARWATVPCPECDTKTVRVLPPRRPGRPMKYKCTSCEWEADNKTDDGLWGDVFAEIVPDAHETTIRSLCAPCVAGHHDDCTKCECRCEGAQRVDALVDAG